MRRDAGFRKLNIAPTNTKFDPIRLFGGLDLLTPPSRLRPGATVDSQNYEQTIGGGYRRIAGYERYDGRLSPSLAVWLSITCNITGALAVGNTITGATSGATGRVISIEAGTGIVAYTKATGAFVVGENITVGGTTRATVTILGGVGAGSDWSAIQQGAAADVYRADIAVVPGTGDVRGGFFYKNKCYAFRDNGATDLRLYVQSAGGWTLVAMQWEVSFTAGSVAPTVGGTITQGANSATVKAVCLQSGTWAGGTAAGRIVCTQPTPANFGAGALTAGGTLTLSGAATSIVLNPLGNGGRVQTDTRNLTGVSKVYGSDGVNRMWEFDGTTLVPIATGVTPDAPKHVIIFKDHVAAAFGPVLKLSGIANGFDGAPYNWTVAAGGFEVRCATDIQSLLRMPGSQLVGTLCISCEDTTEFLYGSSAADWKHIDFEESAGARPFGGQRMGGDAIVFGDLGVYSVRTTQNYGNFLPATLTLNIQPFTEVRRALCRGSLIHRTRSQYRVFFSDGTGLFLTIVNGRVLGAMPVNFPNPVSACWQGRSSDGPAGMFFGSASGYVYQMDVGTSFDGAAIDSFCTLPFANQGNERVERLYRGVALEVQGEGYAAFDLTYQVNYGIGDRPQGSTPKPLVVDLGAKYWDDPTLTWDTLVWDGTSLAPLEARLEGRGVNIALRLQSSSAIHAPTTVSSAILHYTPLKAKKH